MGLSSLIMVFWMNSLDNKFIFFQWLYIFIYINYDIYIYIFLYYKIYMLLNNIFLYIIFPL